MIKYAKTCLETKEPNNYAYMYHFPASNWGMIRTLLYYKVHDIVLGEPLVFSWDEIEKYVHPYTRIRVYPHKGKPNIAIEVEDMPPINHFFILPQHIYLYEQYVDVLELLDNNINRETALINTYLQPEYKLRLKYIIPSISTNITGGFIDEQFMTRRLNCKQDCLKYRNLCHYCEHHEKMYELYAKQHQEELDENIEGS